MESMNHHPLLLLEYRNPSIPSEELAINWEVKYSCLAHNEAGTDSKDHQVTQLTGKNYLLMFCVETAFSN